MKTLKKFRFIPIVFTLVLLVASCSNDDDENDPIPVAQEMNIVETAIETDFLSNLVTAVVEAGLDTTLSGDGPFTVLAPTNTAFAEFMSANGWTSISEIPDAALEQILLNHVIAGEIMSSDLVASGSGYASTFADGAGGNKMSIYFNTNDGVKFNGISEVTTPDIMASNGIIHVVDKVIGLPDIVTFATANPDFSTLVSALTDLTPATNFVDVLSGGGPYTVFAPVNEAFNALSAIPEESELTQILLNHVIDSAISSTDLVSLGSGYTNTMATTPGGENLSLYFNTNSGVSFNGMSNVALADVVAANGIIHAVDAVITLPTIATFATSNPALATLVDVLAYADSGTPTVPYIDTVSDLSSGPFTVFAPTNDAFGNLLTELNITALTDLDTATADAVLLYHIVNANVQSSGLPNGTVTTFGGNLTADNNAFTLTDANGRVTNIITSLVDIQGINGVVHVIDQVLLP